ncbi:unnamed protein product [Didymodactylos carnosus]|uniref:Uncharacterized protein n=1 Tax=Didymodactylos carnosus TaxID=1234261 RepID=A0A8S2ER93_9BILA|nr:unnamed protein product [Didymodactylos carnosus]CAF4024283.1 unnamed protein product [Didymodactylos carnosus]
MLLLQFSIGLSKPNLILTLGPVIVQLLEMKQNGLSLVVNGQQTLFDIQFLFFTADSPALSLFSNFISSAGLCSCFVCLAPGKYDYNLAKVVYTTVDSGHRSLRDYYRDVSVAEEKRQRSTAKKDPTSRGVKGRSVLEPLFPGRLIRCLRPDYMHSTIKCVFDSMLAIILDLLPKAVTDIVDNRLLFVSLPHDFTRKLRSLKYSNYYKANESRTLMLYVFLPCLYGLVDSLFFARLCLFVCAVRLIHGDSRVIEHCEDVADNLFSLFITSNDDGLRKLSNLSLHIHSHFGFFSKEFGSPNYSSCFPFERFLRLFIRNKHGTTNFGEQLSLYHDIDRYLASVSDGLLHCANESEILLLDPFSDGDLAAKVALEVTCGCEMKLYRRVKFKHNVFHSLSYQKKGGSNSYTVQISHDPSKITDKNRSFMEIICFGECAHTVLCFGEVVNEDPLQKFSDFSVGSDFSNVLAEQLTIFLQLFNQKLKNVLVLFWFNI